MRLNFLTGKHVIRFLWFLSHTSPIKRAAVFEMYCTATCYPQIGWNKLNNLPDKRCNVTLGKLRYWSISVYDIVNNVQKLHFLNNKISDKQQINSLAD